MNPSAAPRLVAGLRALSMLGLATLLTLGPAPAGDARASGPLPEFRTAAALTEIRDLRAALVTGSLARALSAGEPHEHRPASEIRIGGSEHIPTALRAPVDDLWSAVVDAGESARSAVLDPALLKSLQDRNAAALRRIAHSFDTRGRVSAARTMETARDRLRKALDDGRLREASIDLAAAIDRALPVLTATAVGVPAGPARVTGCDVFSVERSLCIGSAADNVYTRDFALLIDLGGNDVHANSAGGADPGIDSGAGLGNGNGLNVSVTLDLGGDDRYESGLPSPDGARAVQGAGRDGGIGFLVDVTGNDVYSAIAADAEREDVAALAQGFALSGVGVLDDRSGNDTYTIRDDALNVNHHGRREAAAAGQGTAGSGGTALAIDRSGDDGYLVQALPTAPARMEDAWVAGPTGAAGFGFAASAPLGLFYNAEGNDRIEIVSGLAPLSSDQAPGPKDVFATGVAGAGLGYAGTGLSLTGPGATVWEGSTHASGPVSGGSSASLFGTAVLGSGAVHDTGGNDVYSLTGSSEVAISRRLDDACSCPDDAQVVAETGLVRLEGMGWGLVEGLGMLRDEGGNDTYRATATAVTDIDVVDDRSPTAPDGTARSVTATAQESALILGVQGNASIEGAGLLFDGGGNDLYEADTASTIRAAARATASGIEERARVVSGGTINTSQASSSNGGYGELTDLGGTDSYGSDNRRSVDAAPAFEILVTAIVARVQASSYGGGPARLVDREGGAPDIFSSSPDNPACEGTRGQGTWRDCNSPRAYGFNY